MLQHHEDIRFQRAGKAGIVTLARPDRANMLTPIMVRALATVLANWAEDETVRFVVIRAAGPVFSAGIDFRTVCDDIRAGQPPVEFFAEEYRLNALVAKFPKPVVSVVDGTVAGAGAGIAFLGSHCVVTEHASYAAPETTVGFFPDAGATFLLSGLYGRFGMLLGLTGVSISWGDALWCGLATHAVPSADILGLLNEMCREDAPDAALKRFGREPPRETDDATVYAIATHFSRDSLPGIAASLEMSSGPRDPFAARMLRLLKVRSPTSLAIAFGQIESGAMLTIDECMKMEFRILNRMMTHADFPEGVRARARKVHPLWQPELIGELDPRTVEKFFAPLASGELAL